MKVHPALARSLIRGLGLLPLPINHALGGLLGLLAARRPSKLRRAARVNLELCFPELSAAERGRLLRQALRETGKTVTEAAVFWTRKPARLERLVREVRGEELLDAAWARGKGVIVAVPHLGAWELMGIYWARRLPLNSLYRPPRHAELEPLLRAARERGGGKFHPATARGVRGLRKALEARELVAILPDQEPAAQGVFAPFFGVPAKTMTLLPRLAQKTGAPVLFAYAERLSWGRGYRIRFLPAPAGIASPDPEEAARALNAGVEACVRLLPEQYQWTYRRFRRQPGGTRDPYAGKPL